MEHGIMTNSLLGPMQWGLTLIFLFSCPWRPKAFLHMANEQNHGAQNRCDDQGGVPWKVCVLHHRDIKKCSAGGLGLVVDVALRPGLKATSLAWDERSDGLESKGDLCCWVMRDSWFPPPPFFYVHYPHMKWWLTWEFPLIFESCAFLITVRNVC